MARRKSRLPFGLGGTKPHHFLQMGKIAWRNRSEASYAWRVLNDGVCDGCALGTTGLRDWTLDGTHLCLVRLNLLELNTMGPLDPKVLEDASALPVDRPRYLRRLGRLPYPLRRRAGEAGFTVVSWETAINELGARLHATDPHRMACYLTSRGISNEVYFAAQKAFRALGSPNVDNAARLCHSPSTAAMKKTLGVAASTCSYKDWYGSDVVVFFGSNPANDQPVALKYLYEAKKQGTRVLVVNTYREPGMDRYWIPSNADSALFGTTIADRFFEVTSGGDLAFIYAVQKCLLSAGAIDRTFIERHTEGFDAYRAHLDGLRLDDLVQLSGARREDIDAFAQELSQASTGVFIWSMGLTQHAHGTDTVAALCCLGLSKGFVGRERCGLMPIRGHSGVQGGAEMGAYATAFPGGPIDDANADRLEATWGFRPPVEIGLDTIRMLEAASDGDLDVLYAVGGNFRDTMPQPDAVEETLANIPVRVHQDIFLTTSMLIPPKDLVYLLPARTRYEHRGGVTETSTERRVIFSPFIPGHEIGEAREEWRIIVDIARRAGAPVDYPDATAIRRDIAKAVPAYDGIQHLAKKGDQFQWGGPRLCEGGDFPFPNRRARFSTAVPPDRSLPEGRFHLATRRGKQFNSIVQADNDELTGADRDHVLMNAEDMARLGLQDHSPVRVVNEHGELRARALTAPIAVGNLQMFWPEANSLIPDGRFDAGGMVPDYNAVVRLDPL
ncbi:MAG: FdhF/YdeP family oxidoreductase [Myxococcota bacterium]